MCVSVCVCMSVCMRVGGVIDIKRTASVECILNSAEVDKKRWHQFSKIKRKPTVLLSASVLGYKSGS